MTPLRIALLCDFAEEHWPSMDLVAAMLLNRLRAEHADTLHVSAVRPRFVRLFSRLTASRDAFFNADRILNRFVQYPRCLRRIRSRFDVFHVIDHSYSHLVHHLPAASTVVTCHDLDSFRCILEPASEPRSWPFRAMTRRIAAGLCAATRVTCVSHATGDELLRHRLVSPARLTTIPNGVHPAFLAPPTPPAERAADAVLGPPREGGLDLLHVGSTIARKRIDVLIRVFAGLRENFPAARLLRVGGPLTTAQAALAASLGIADSIVIIPFVDNATLAAIYRRAALMLMPSESEGFGLPMVEAMASGTPVLASAIAALTEVGGSAADYVPVGDLTAWIFAATRLLRECTQAPLQWSARRAAARDRSRRFSWSESAAAFGALYRELDP